MASVKLKNLVKDYGSVRAVNGVNLEIEDGEFVVFIGPSGCGKSTLLRMIAGLEEISDGTLSIGENVVNLLEPRERNVAMVFQDYALYPHMSVAGNIGFGLKMRNVDAATIDKTVKETAEILQIENLLDRKPAQLSGGQRQRVAMGRAIVRKPALFLFDEPLSNLDAKLRVDMRIQIKRLHKILKTTTIYVTHDQVEAMTLADRIVILRDGNIEQQGAPIDVYTAPANRFVAEFIGSPQMNIMSGVLVEKEGPKAIQIGDQQLAIGGISATLGDKVLLGIRPEHLEVSAAPSDISGKIDAIDPLGSDTMLLCKVGDQEFFARIPADYPVSLEQDIHFSVARHRLHLFDAKSGLRININ
ncbi:MAG: ABC transporter ATP-binding protein [Paracoccaceae bacterium]